MWTNGQFNSDLSDNSDLWTHTTSPSTVNPYTNVVILANGTNCTLIN